MIGWRCLMDIYNEGRFLTVLIRTCWEWCGTLHFMVPPTSVLHDCDLWDNYLSAAELYANKPPYSESKHHLQINLKGVFISAFMLRPSIITADTRKEMKRGCWQVEEEKLQGVFWVLRCIWALIADYVAICCHWWSFCGRQPARTGHVHCQPLLFLE